MLDTVSPTRARNIRSAGVKHIKWSISTKGIAAQQVIVGDVVVDENPPAWVLDRIPDGVLQDWGYDRCIYHTYIPSPQFIKFL